MHTSSRITTPARRSLAVAGVLAVLLVACGDDDASDAASTEAAATDAPAATTGVASADGAETTDGERTRPAYADDVAAAPASEAPAATDAGETAASADGEVITELTLVETDLGTIIADGGGRTLYLFLPDEQGPSTCTEGCIEIWPALSGPVGAGEGIDESLIGTATRPDTGAEQATYDGWPLYYFVQDVAAGDTNGQGLNDIWFVLDASGEAVEGG